MARRTDIEEIDEQLREATNALAGIALALTITVGAILIAIAYLWANRV